MNMKVKLRTADAEIVELKNRLQMWRSMAFIFGFGCISLGIAIIGLV